MATLKDLKEWMEQKVRPDASRVLIATWLHQNYTDDSNTKDFLQRIQQDPLQWYKDTPPEYTKDAVFRKLNTALYKVLDDNEAVKAELGEQEAKDLKDTLRQTRSKHIKEIEEYKKQQTQEISDEEHNSVSSEEEDTTSAVTETEQESVAADESLSQWEQRYRNLQQICTENRETIKNLQSIIEKQEKQINALSAFVKETVDSKTWALLSVFLDQRSTS